MQLMQKIHVRSLSQEDPLEEDMATHSSILAWRIPWTEEPGGLQSAGSQRARHNFSNWARMQVNNTIMNIIRVWCYSLIRILCLGQIARTEINIVKFYRKHFLTSSSVKLRDCLQRNTKPSWVLKNKDVMQVLPGSEFREPEIQVLSAGLLLESLEESACSLIQIVGKLSFLLAVGLRSLFLCERSVSPALSSLEASP